MKARKVNRGRAGYGLGSLALLSSLAVSHAVGAADTSAAANSVSGTNTLAQTAVEGGGIQTMPEVTITAKRTGPQATTQAPETVGYTPVHNTTGTKTDTPVFESAVSIQSVPQEVLRDRQVVRLQEAVRSVSGVQPGFEQGGLYDNFIIRGFNSQNIVYRNGFRQFQTQIDMANIERVDILKGAAASLYGRTEPGGLVNLVTKKPLAKPYYSLEQQFGSFDFYRTVADATGPITADGSLLYRAVVAYQNNNSFRDFVENERILISPSLTWNPSVYTQFNLNFEYRNFDDRIDNGIPAIGNRPAGVPRERFFGVIGTPLSNTESYLVDFNWSHKFNEQWGVRHKFVWWSYDNQINDSGGFVTDDTSGLVDLFVTAPYSASDTFYFTEFDINGKFRTFGLQHDLLLGAEYYRRDSKQTFLALDSQTNADALFPISLANPVYQRFRDLPRAGFNNVFNPGDEWIAVFLQDQIKINDKLRILLSGRYDNSTPRVKACDTFSTPTCPNNVPTLERTSEAFTPRVGINYEVIPQIALFGSYSESFGTDNVGAGALRGGGVPEPETSRQYEAGIKSRWLNDRLTASVAYFNLKKSNLTGPDPNDPINAIIQTGEARSQGVELDVAGQVTKNWRVIGAYTYTDAEITKDEPVTQTTDDDGNPLPQPIVLDPNGNQGNTLPNVPTHAVSLWSQYDFNNGFGFGGGLYAATEREGDRENTYQLPGYVRFDIGASYKRKIGASRLSAQLNVVNLLDKDYFTASNESRFNITPGAARTLLGSVRIEF